MLARSGDELGKRPSRRRISQSLTKSAAKLASLEPASFWPAKPLPSSSCSTPIGEGQLNQLPLIAIVPFGWTIGKVRVAIW